MRLRIFYCLLVVLVGGASCQRSTLVPSEDLSLGRDYFPVKMGHWIEYTVDSIIYNDFNETTDTFRMEFQDRMTDTFLDAENRPSMLVERMVRQDSTYPWTELMTYAITQTSARTDVVENNLQFIKMVFPVKYNTRWYGNLFIPTDFNPDYQWYKDWDYRYDSIASAYQHNNLYYPQTLWVNQADRTEGNPADTNAFSARTYSRERYARGVGLVYKELTRWVYQPAVNNYRKGFTLILHAKKYAE
jgi:hypothetical protein